MASGRPWTGKYNKLNVEIGDAELKELMRDVIAFEAYVRHRPKGQACYELVMEAVDAGSYPPELRQRLAELEEESGRLAVERSLRNPASVGHANEGEGA